MKQKTLINSVNYIKTVEPDHENIKKLVLK